MKLMKVILPMMLIAVSGGTVRADDTGTWTIGPNFGFVVLSSGGQSITSLGVPSGGGLFVGSVQPGMRIGYVVPSGALDVYVDAGLNVISGNGETVHSLLSTFNAQFNFSREMDTTPYATVGLGFARLGGGSFGGASETDGLFGGGFGLRHRISGGHGAMRGEVRYDRLRISDGANGFGLKLGVDLWIP